MILQVNKIIICVQLMNFIYIIMWFNLLLYNSYKYTNMSQNVLLFNLNKNVLNAGCLLFLQIGICNIKLCYNKKLVYV